MILVTLAAAANLFASSAPTLTVAVTAPAKDVQEAVAQVTQDQIIHGTYSYEKERILYGAHSADAAHVFGSWKGQGAAYYKVASGILSPRFFKDSGDIGTISVRYVVTETTPDLTTLQIDAVFVDARNVKHPSLGNVESSEYASILQHLKTIQASRNPALAASTPGAVAPASNSPSPLLQPASPTPLTQPGAASSTTQTAQDLEKKVEALRHQVELRVKDSGAPLKSAPYQSATTLESLPANAEVLIVVLTPYWYGVETTEGHRGWIYHSKLEPLP